MLQLPAIVSVMGEDKRCYRNAVYGIILPYIVVRRIFCE